MVTLLVPSVPKVAVTYPHLAYHYNSAISLVIYKNLDAH